MASGLDSKRAIVYFAVSVALTCASVAAAQNGPGAAFEAGLVRCSDVNQPTALANCGTDRLQGGSAEISAAGEVEVTVVQAAPNATYEVVYRSVNGSTQRPIGQLTTDASGNGYLDTEHFFASNHVGSGNIVLKRGGFDQFLTGFKFFK